MYTPEWFRLDDKDLVLKVIREHSFATLFSTLDGQPIATHLPLVIDQEDPLVLTGHVAFQNQQTACFDGKSKLLAVFQGPHAYVSPSSYATSPNVPTWNYVVVHATGTATALNAAESLQSLQALVAAFDPDLGSTNPEAVESAFWTGKLKGIVAFTMKVVALEGKAKMSQNRPKKDQQSVISNLRNSDRENDVGTLEWMEKLNNH